MSSKQSKQWKKIAKVFTTAMAIGASQSLMQASAAETRLIAWGGMFEVISPNLEGFSDGTTVNLPIRNVTQSKLNSGWFGGLSIASTVDDDNFSFDEIEWYFEAQVTETDKNSLTSIGVAAIPFVNGLVAGIGPVPLTAKANRARFEVGAKLSGFADAETFHNLQITPFIGIGQERATQTGVFTGFGLTTNKTNMDWKFGGAMIGSSHTMNIVKGLDLVLEGNVGIYAYHANGTVSGVHSLSSREASISDNGFGARANAQLEFRKSVSPTIDFSIFGLADFWSSVPYTRLAEPEQWAPLREFGIGAEPIFDAKVGVKLTVKLAD